MKVRILKAGIYLDGTLRAKTCAVGAVLETKAWYGSNMIQTGQAEALVDEAPKTKTRTRRAPASEKKSRRTGGSNPFLS